MLEGVAGYCHAAASSADRTRSPVERPQVIQHGSLDTSVGVGAELDPSLRIETTYGLEQPDESYLYQIFYIHVGGQAERQPAC